MRGESSAVAKALQPAPSLSRTGRMADLAMSTATLAKAGAAGFTAVRKKEAPPAILVAEVVDATLLDPFGTRPPQTDAGRHAELLSSPRHHPQLVAKQGAQREAELQEAFRRGVGAEVEEVGEDPAARRERLARERLERHQRMFVMDEDDALTPGHRRPGPEPGSYPFRAVPRVFKPYNLDIPGVGHYRPRFTVVDQRPPTIPPMRPPGRSDAVLPSPAPAPGASTPAGNGLPGADPGLGRTLPPAEGPASALAPEAGSFRIDPVGTAPTAEQRAAPPKATPAEAEEGATHQYRSRAPRSLGSSMFMSNSPNRPRPSVNMLDRCYFPYNEALTRPRALKGAFVEFDAQLDRSGRRGMPEAHSLDVVYNPRDPDGWRARGPLSFDQALPREAPSGGRLHQAHVDPAAAHCGGIAYDAEPPRRHTPSPDFNKAPRDAPSSFIRPSPCSHTGPYDFQETERTLRGRRSPAWRLDSQTERPPLNPNEHHDLEYNVNPAPTQRSVPQFDFNRIKAHQELWDKPITSNCSYEPNPATVLPRIPDARDFNVVLTRDQVARAGPAAPGLDLFYNAESPLTQPRITGDPMMRTHVSRDKRLQVTQGAKGTPDAFYDYDIEKSLPRHCPGGPLDLAKTTSRADRPLGLGPLGASLQSRPVMRTDALREGRPASG